MRRRAVLVPLLAAASALLAGVGGPPPAVAAGPPAVAPAPAPAASLDRSIAFLEHAQNSDGGFGTDTGAGSEPVFTAWASLALAAAGINPRAQRFQGSSAYGYLSASAASLTLVPDFERALLVADAAGTDPHDFGGRDILATLLSARLADGSFPYRFGEATPSVDYTAFAVIALSLVDEPAARVAVATGAEWLVGASNADGSWPSGCPRSVAPCQEAGSEPPGEVDATAAAVEALNAAGLHGTEAQDRALAWMHSTQLSGGGLPEYPGEPEANVASTAWAAQALWSAAVQPESWAAPAGDPLSYMVSMQQPDGSIDWRQGQRSAPVWMTAYVAPALSGRQLPIDPVPMPVEPATPQTAPDREPAGPAGQPSRAPGGSSRDGVRTGGGGNGAPLFSKPQPQSRGRTPGGERSLSGQPRQRSRAATAGQGASAAGALTAAGLRATGSSGASGGGGREVSGLLLAASHSPAAPGLATARGPEPGTTLAAMLGLAALAAFALGAAGERRRAGSGP